MMKESKEGNTHLSATWIGLVTLFARLCKVWCQGRMFNAQKIACTRSRHMPLT